MDPWVRIRDLLTAVGGGEPIIESIHFNYEDQVIRDGGGNIQNVLVDCTGATVEVRLIGVDDDE